MKEIEDLKTKIKDIIAKVEDKDIIGQLSQLNGDIDKIGVKTKEQETKYNGLLDSYKEVVIHTSFKPNGTEDQDRGSSTAPDIVDFLNKAIENKDKKEK